MKKLPLALALLAGLVVVASGHVVLTPLQINALTQLDALPSRDQLNSVHADDAQNALANLREVALSNPDPAVQIRAIRSLPQYCAPPCLPTDDAHTTLVTLLETPRYRDARTGSDVLVLRAGIESLGLLQVDEDIDLLIPQLSHPSRDIRATVARALRDLGNPLASDALRARLAEESIDQVKRALEDALRVLGQPVQ